jgi:hypothetical protein
MQLFASAPVGDDEVGGCEDVQVLRDGLTGHVEVGAQLGQRLAVALVQSVEQHPAAAVGEGFEDDVGVFHRTGIE